MKVTLINTADGGGGAAAACMRLLKALVKQRVAVHMLVQQKRTDAIEVSATTGKLKSKIDFLRERLPFLFFYEKNKAVRFAFSTAVSGTGITHQPTVQEADIIHLHWTNSGYLSIENLQDLFDSGKPIVWTLHDMWAFTGGCHYAGHCNHFVQQCGDCWMLRKPHKDDLSHTGWLKKSALLRNSHKPVIVTCSNWLADVARKSTLLHQHRIEVIPNPIDTAVFGPQDKTVSRNKWRIDTDKKVILFGAANINDKRKGITYLAEALHILKTDTALPDVIEIVIFGKNKHFDVKNLPFKVHELDIIRSETELAEIYNLADVFISPSVEDNLPNMVMEALACATPVVAFDTGGISDMVDHLQNGYLAQIRSAADLAAGLKHILYDADTRSLAEAARQKVLRHFAPDVVAAQYLSLYQSLLKHDYV